MTDFRYAVCAEPLRSVSEWHDFPCGRRAKWLVTDALTKRYYVCGVHVRRFRKWDQERVTIEALP